MALVDPALSAALLGFLLGLQHATDPDHLVAVATIVTGERRALRGALIGLAWGAGHTVTLAASGALIIGLGLTVPRGVGQGLELGVALMLIGLGVLRLRASGRGLGAVSFQHLQAEHEHGHVEVFHSHGHGHGERTHRHPHVHPSKRLLAALGARPGASARVAAVGAAHGLAGSAALSLVVLATVSSPLGAVLYLAVFGLGTLLGMMVFSLALAWPVALAHRAAPVARALQVGSGLGAVAVGLAWGLRAL